jgi:adenosylhomocysteine nucleosidase
VSAEAGAVNSGTPDGLLVVVGMAREARIIGGRAKTLIGGAGLGKALERRPEGLVSFGLCGGLDPALKVGDLILAGAVLSAGRRIATDATWTKDLRVGLPGAVCGEIAAGDVMVASPIAKASLRNLTGAIAVDMESHLVAAAAARAGLPFIVIRAVSDPAGRTLPRAAQAGFRPDGKVDVGAVLWALLRSPGEAPGLIRTAMDAAQAFQTLRRAAQALTSPPPSV